MGVGGGGGGGRMTEGKIEEGARYEVVLEVVLEVFFMWGMGLTVLV